MSESQERTQKNVPGIGRIFKPRWKKNGVWYENPIWWIAYYHRGKEYRESSESESDAQALKRLKERVKQLGRGTIIPIEEKVTFESMAKDLLYDYEINAKRSSCSARLSISHLSQYFGLDKALDITTDRVRSYISQRQKEDASNTSINRELSALKRMFALAVQAGKLSTRPFIPTLEENNARQGFLDHGSFLAVKDRLPDALKDALSFLYHSAWRVGEMRSLEWRDVDLEGKFIRLRPEISKNKDGRLLYLNGELLEIIKRAEMRRQPDCVYVFHRNGERIGDFRKTWKTACKNAGLDGILVHDLRRTAVRNMIRAGVPERVAMALSGHKTRSIFDRYNIVSEADLIQASEKIHAHLQTRSQTPKVMPMTERKRD